MFSLPTWVTNIDIKTHINIEISDLSKAKKTYNSLELLKKSIQTIKQNYGGYYQIFTDGSKDNGGTGAAFFDPQANANMCFKLDRKTSIMAAELYAICESLSYILSCREDNFVLLCDSKSALQHLIKCTSGARGIPIAYCILRLFSQACMNGKNIKMQWIPSHINLVGNEVVDNAARNAIYEGISVDRVPFFTDFLQDVKQECATMWKEYFDGKSVEKGIWYKTIQSEPPKVPWFASANLTRQLLVISMRLRSGHIPLNAFGHLMKVVDSPNCTTCGIREDTYHALVECVRIEAERRQLEFMAKVNLRDIGSCNAILANPTSELAVKLYVIIFKLIKSRS
ncbi:hypothetical protein ABMA28_011694 [Loxostege sticticalis]|uniref:RNase H type-1 domain-containing protein n=1 Tax=Loxostege sticticalis TaxID=481309 RepID=A0ABD0TK76_LOXSC